jgi:hypothetical protein
MLPRVGFFVIETDRSGRLQDQSAVGRGRFGIRTDASDGGRGQIVALCLTDWVPWPRKAASRDTLWLVDDFTAGEGKLTIAGLLAGDFER